MKSWSLSEVGRRLHDLPMLRVLLPLAGGIVAESLFALPALYLWGGLFVCGCCALRFRSGLYMALCLLLLGMSVAALHRQQVAPPLDRQALYRLRIEQLPREGERYSSTSARIEAWCDPQGVWRGSERRVTLFADTTLLPRMGELLEVVGSLRPYRSDSPFYPALQRARGYVGVLWVGRHNLIDRDTTPQLGPFAQLHRWAVERIERLDLEGENRAVVEAMSVGERRALNPSLREAYARSGASHLLAVSGLHVGILFLALNGLLFALPLLRGGHRLRSLLAALLIWLYAALCGASPSVLRAAWMFSALQFALAFSLRYHGLNILFGAAVVMLLLEPMQLFDISFQLSFLAVAAILSWGVPLLGGLRNRTLRGIAALFCVGGVAALATAPLVALRFGLFSPVGVVLNPLLLILAQLLLLLSLLWILLPLALWQPLFAWAIEGVATLQNRLVEWVAEWPYAAFEVESNAPLTLTIYLLLVLLTLIAWGWRATTTPKLEDDDLG